jgi:adenosylcobinamide-phosphate synthase
MLSSLPLIGFLLDLLFKDPPHLPHPVRWIGALLDRLETWSRKQRLLSLRQAGAVSVLAAVGAVAAIAWLLLSLPLLGLAAAVYLAYAGLSLAGLLQAAREVLLHADNGDLAEARSLLGLLVSRDTSQLEREAVYSSVAETVSENFNDGFVAPLFFLLLGGPVALWAFKTVSTVDSMWGYRDAAWKDLGWFGARLDDVLAYIPARLSSILLLLAAALTGLSLRGAWREIPRQARQLESPNAGWPMATAAWCLQSTIGGTFFYRGKKKVKPRLGPPDSPWSGPSVRKLLRLVLLAACLGVLLGQLPLWLM